MNSNQLTVAVYIRVSTDKQDDNTSKETQLEIIKNYINSTWPNRKVNTIIYNETMSASLSPKNLYDLKDYSYDMDTFYEMIHRPELKRLILDGRLKKFTDVLVYSHDRLSRNEYERFIIKFAFNTYKLQLHYCKAGESLNSDSKDMNDLVDNLLNWLSVNESLTISRRVKDGSKKVIESGKWAGGNPPFGYKLLESVSNKKCSLLKIEPLSASVVRRIFDLYLLGYSPTEISKKVLIEYPYFCNRKWTKNSILDILKNPTYTGHLTWNKHGGKNNPKRRSSNEFVSANFNEDICIIEKDIWDKAKVLMNSRQKSSKVYSTPFLLKDIIKCSHCGEPLKCKNHGNITGRVYMCANPSCRKISSVKAEELHTVVIEKIQLEFVNLANENTNIEMFFNSYINVVNDINRKSELEIKTFKSKIDENNKIIQLSNDKAKELEILLSSFSPTDYDVLKSKYILDSVKEVDIIKKKEISLIKRNIEEKEKSKLRLLSSKEELKELIDTSKLFLESILNESSDSEKIQKLRIFLVNIFEPIFISDNYTLMLIFK